MKGESQMSPELTEAKCTRRKCLQLLNKKAFNDENDWVNMNNSPDAIKVQIGEHF